MIALFIVLTVIIPSLGHEVSWGSCPEVDPVADFDMERFEGLWYVIEKFDSDEKCVTWNISKSSVPNTWQLLERRASGFLPTVGLTQDSLHTATLTPDPNNPGVVLVNWRLNFIGTYRMVIHTTDYERFAGVFECQQVTFFQRQQATVLSRSPTLQIDLRQTTRLDTSDILVEYYRPVYHGGCGYGDISILSGAGSADPGPLASSAGDPTPFEGIQ